MVVSTAVGSFAINIIIAAICLYVLLRRGGRDWLAYMAFVHLAAATVYGFVIPYPAGPALDSYLRTLAVLPSSCFQSMGAVGLVAGVLRLYGKKVDLRVFLGVALGAAALTLLVGLVLQPFSGFVLALIFTEFAFFTVGGRMVRGPTAFYRLVGVSLLMRGVFIIGVTVLTAMQSHYDLLNTIIVLNMIFISMTGFGVLLIELDDGRQRVVEADHAKTMFIANMSHELRTPLNAVIGFSEIVQSGLVPVTLVECRTYAGHVLNSGRHLLSFINQLLDMATIEARRETLRYEVVRMRELVGQCVHMVRHEAEQLGVVIDAKMDAAADRIVTDPRAVRQIITSLVSNAVKFSKAGSRVVVDLRPGEGNGCCQVTVTDDGIGMNEAQIARAFEPFWQGESTYARNRGGLGLGLAIVKRLVVALDATIKVDSQPGRGTAFVVVIPSQAGVIGDD